MYVTPCIACGVGRPYKNAGEKKRMEIKQEKKVGKVEIKIEKKNLKIGIDLMTYAFLK
jgi:hypothetical protein